MKPLNTEQVVQLNGVMNATGWTVVIEIAELAVSEIEREALDCEDENKVVQMQREARAARKFLTKYRILLESHRQAAETPTDEFIPVMTG